MDAQNITILVTILGSLLTFFGLIWRKVAKPAIAFIDKHEDLAESVEIIKTEITVNGGGSLKDVVCKLGNTCDRMENRQKIIEQRTRASLHYSTTALIETDRKGRVVWTNEPFHEMTGQTLSDMRGFDWINYVQEDERDEFLVEFNSCIEMNRKFSKEIKTSDGKEIRMIGYPYKLNDNEQGGFLISLSEA